MMFTALRFGLCAFVIEAADQGRLAISAYPAVGIGIIDRNECRVSLVLSEGTPTPGMAINRSFHSFRVEKISETAAVLWIDNTQTFSIPRGNAL
jgi:hypothetical protein